MELLRGKSAGEPDIKGSAAHRHPVLVRSRRPDRQTFPDGSRRRRDLPGRGLRPGDDADAVRWAAPAELPGLGTTDGLLEHLVRFGVLPR